MRSSEFKEWEYKTLLEYPHKVSISDNNYNNRSLAEIRDWADNRFGCDTFVWSLGGRFYFHDSDNAVIFALRWA